VNIFAGDQSEAFKDDPVLSKMQPVYIEVPRGSVAFHHGLTVHMAKQNRTDRMRRVHTMIFLADGARRTTMAMHPSVDRPRIAVGELIASDLTPIAWPRRDGDWPTIPDYAYDSRFKRFLASGAFPTTAKYQDD
jgi:ectoine hydroxylase-related dioxygenase (phytanoyl-CoA dioxygenase family)